MPTVKGPAGVVLYQTDNVGESVSSFTGEQQVQSYEGVFWGLDVELPPLSRAEAAEWIAFLKSLRGKWGDFLAGDPVATAPRGVGTGTPLVKGASQTGRELITDGWTISTTGILLADDPIQLGTGASARLHTVLKDVNSDGGGNATLDIWPPLRESPADNASITLSNTVGVFKLTDNTRKYSIGEAMMYGLSFSAREKI